MKKISTIVLPSLIILAYTCFNVEGKNILEGLFLLFPLTFIIQGAIYSDFKKKLLLGFILSSIAFIVPINLLYHMGSCIELLVIYNVLGIISFFVKKKISSKKDNNTM